MSGTTQVPEGVNTTACTQAKIHISSSFPDKLSTLSIPWDMLCSGYFLLYLAKPERVFLQVVTTPPKALQAGFSFFSDLADQDLKTPHNSERPSEAPHGTHKAGVHAQGEGAQPVLCKDGCIHLCDQEPFLFTRDTNTKLGYFHGHEQCPVIFPLCFSIYPTNQGKDTSPPQPMGFCVPCWMHTQFCYAKDSSKSPLCATAKNTNIPKWDQPNLEADSQ